MAKVVKKRRVASQTYDSLAALKKSTKRGGGGASGKIAFIPEDPITVRFLSEPETWIGYYEHYNGPTGDPRYSPCVKDSSPGGCDYEPYQGNKPVFRFLANAYIVDDSKVKALKMPKSLVDQLTTFASKWGTVLDRDYELSRSGSGMDTTYAAIPEDKSPIKIARFRKDMSDLQQLLEDWADEQDAADDEEEEPVRRKSRGRQVEDDDEDDDEDEDDEPPSVPKRGTSRRVKSSGSTGEFRPKRRPASTKGVEDDEDEKPRRTAKKTAAKKTVVARRTSTPAKKVVAAKRVVRRTR